MPQTHKIERSEDNFHKSFSNEYKPMLTIQSGDTVKIQTIDVGWGYTGKDVKRVHYRSRENETVWGHPVIGPIAIEEAKAGGTLEISINNLVPSWYGWTCAAGKSNWQNDQLKISDREEVCLDWAIDTEKAMATCTLHDSLYSVPIRPFMGVMSTAPSENGVHSTIPPRYCGGNIDCKELVKGSTLLTDCSGWGTIFSWRWSCCSRRRGGIWTSDRMPNGNRRSTLTVREDIQLKMPRANTPAGWITFGFGEDLN